MALKFRSKVNYAQIYAGDKGGYNLGLDGAVFLRKESIPRTFQPPRIGTQGKSTSAASPSADISSGTDTSLKVNVDGKGIVTATIASVTGLDTGPEIADALEIAINNALVAAGYNARVWAEYTGSLYIVHSQSTGIASSVVITDAVTNNVADNVKLGLGAGGLEVVGTDDVDFLLYTQGGPKFSQPIESNAHRSGRFHTGIIKKKKMAEWSVTTYVNMSGTAGDSIDTTVRLLWEQLLGTEVVSAGNFIKYTQGLPSFYMSLVRVSTIFGEYYTGAYTKENQVAFPGDGPATCQWQGKASTRSISGLAKLSAGSVASATVTLQALEASGYTEGGRVMLVDTDGVTVLAGADGALYVSTTDDLTVVVLNSVVTAPLNGYLVPWHPGAVGQTGRDAIFTDLAGSFKLRAAGSAIDVTSIGLHLVNDHVDLDNRFGKDANAGYVAGNRLTATLTVGFDLSNENYREVVQTEKFLGFDPLIVLGTATGRRLEITAKKWLPAVPSIEVPENGTTPITLEGILYQSAPGAQDPFEITFK